MLKLDDILSKVKSYNPEADLEIIRQAYAFSEKAHAGQKRLSGQPFLIHPLEVANILAEMKLDVASVVAGILHDTIEDTQAKKEDIEKLFGKDIAELVDGVTKLSKLQFNSREERQAENFRKMILAMSRDIRVILIKLADRLNNLRTLQFMPEEKQMRIAEETFDIYAPLANRLGMQWMKIQLEDLSFRFLKAEIARQIEKKIERVRKNREEYIARVIAAVMEQVGRQVGAFDISGRMKHTYSIYRKMERQNINFEQIHDLLAFRIICPSVEKCYEILGHLHSFWKPVPGRFKDYIAMPKQNNYQSLHTTVVCLDGERVEFQIRNQVMHDIAERGIAAHWKYKEDGRIDTESQKTFTWMRQLVDWQNELKDSLEFMDTVKLDMFTQDIYAFTPKGDVRALPYGATPIDFAYSIHTDVGSHCAGARVNGRIVPLSYKLNSGDEVEIMTHTRSQPVKDWLQHAASSRAKAKIRQHLKIEQRDRSLTLGQNIFEEECRKIGAAAGDVFGMQAIKDYLTTKGIVGESALYAEVAYGKISVPVMLQQILPDKKQEPEKDGIIRRIFKKASLKNKNLVLVSGLGDILVTFGKCCSPIPGDSIVGFVTRGRGVKLHRVECPKVPAIDPLRRVQVAWNEDIEAPRRAKLKIATENKTGMLASVAQSISERKVSIAKAVIKTTRDEKAILALEVDVNHVNDLHAIMKAVEKIKGVISVEREMNL